MIKTTAHIEGMQCGMCESHINEAIRNALPVKKVTSSHIKKETVILSEKEINEADLRDVIDKTGYTFLSAESEPYEKKGLFGIFKK